MRISNSIVGLFLVSQLGNLSAQNLASVSGVEIPSLIKVQGDTSTSRPAFAAQNVATLESGTSIRRALESVVDLGSMADSSPCPPNPIDALSGIPGTSGEEMKQGLAMISAVYREVGKPEQAANCANISLSVEERIKLDPSKLLEVVASEIGANPACVCEIVKAAITSSDADVACVVSIVEVSIVQSPETMRIAAQCAIASVPESIYGVQAVLTKLDPNGGDSGASSKSAKDGKSGIAAAANTVAALANPLDFPGTGPVGPNVGGHLGIPLIPPLLPVIVSPPVTDVNPR